MSDLISRQAAIDELGYCQTYLFDSRDKDKKISLEDAEYAIEQLPSAQPEPKEEHWIPHESPDGSEQYECSRCGVLWEFDDGTPEDNEAYFCLKCGTKMKGADT